MLRQGPLDIHLFLATIVWDKKAGESGLREEELFQLGQSDSLRKRRFSLEVQIFV